MHQCGATILITEAVSPPRLPLGTITSTLALQRKRYWSKRSTVRRCLLQLYKEGLTNKEGLCSGVDLSVEWTIMGGRWGDRVHEEGKD